MSVPPLSKLAAKLWKVWEMVVATMNLAEFERTHKFFLNQWHALDPLGEDSSLTDHFCLENEKGK